MPQLPAHPTQSLRDADLNFEAILKRLGKITRVTFDITTLTWPGGAANSNIATVPHGFGVVPYVVALPLVGAGGLTQNFTVPLVVTRTTSDFQLQVRTQDGSVQPNTATQPVMWVAFA